MNKLLLSFLVIASSISFANSADKITIQLLEQNMILCDSQFARTSDDLKYKQCIKNVFDAYDEYIKTKRLETNFANQVEWKKFQLNELKQNSACQEYAKGTTTNSTLLRSIYFCQHVMYLNLANKSTL